MCAAMPRLARFVTEFGAQAVPEHAGFMHPERWPDLDWPALGRSYALQKDAFDHYVPPADYETFDAWRAATQEYQAQVIRFHIETLRRLKYRPNGGFCQFSFGDAQPGVTWSVLDHERSPKRGYRALAAACAPVIVVATRPARQYSPGESAVWSVHVVSDLRTPFNGVVTATMAWGGGSRAWAWEGEVPADECVRVGTIRWDMPSEAGPVHLDLALAGPGISASNHYETRIGA
jgi:beta-mannosidase